MAYAAWSVIAGEQPTASKWNILGTNDASFNDGTGIAAGAIGTSALASSAVTTAKIDFTSFDVYSTSETDTGRKWIDARTIYRKVLQGNMTVVVGTVNVAHGISGITTGSELLRADGNFWLSSTTRTASRNLFFHRETGGNWAHPVAFDATNIRVTASFAWGSTAYTFILEYVK